MKEQFSNHADVNLKEIQEAEVIINNNRDRIAKTEKLIQQVTIQLDDHKCHSPDVEIVDEENETEEKSLEHVSEEEKDP